MILTLAALFAVWFSFSLVGARAGKGAALAPEYHPLMGWGIAVLLMLALGSVLAQGVLLAVALFMALSVGLLLQRKLVLSTLLSPYWLLGVLLIAPLLYHLTFFQAREWDDFSHWLPNAFYLFKQGDFPRQTSPEVYAWWPGYPYALALVTASTSWLGGTFVECCGPLLNLLLITLLAAFVARCVAKKPENFKQTAPLAASLTLLFLACALGLDRFSVISSYADTATSVLLAFVLYCGQDFIGSCAKNLPLKRIGIAFALIAVVFIQIKQANFYLLLIATASLWLCADNKKEITLPLAFALLPAFVVQGGWEWYKQFNLPGRSFSLVGSQWYGDLAGFMFAAMAGQAWQHLPFFLLLAGLGLLALCRKSTAPHTRLLRAFALTTLGYYGFLCLAYLGSTFSNQEVRDAASFTRYISHVGFSGLMVAVLLAADFLRQKQGRIPAWIPALSMLPLFILPLAATAFALLGGEPQMYDFVETSRNFADAAFHSLPKNAKVAVISPHSMGMEAMIANYRWALQASSQNHPMVTGRLLGYAPEKTPDAIKSFAQSYDALILPPNDATAWQAFDLPVGTHWSLLRKQGQGWQRVNP